MRYLIFAVLLAGCAGSFQPRNFSEAVALADSTISSAAVLVHKLCGNTVPGGPCTDDSLIDTDEKEAYAEDLRGAARDVDTMKAVWRAGGDGDWRSLEVIQSRLDHLLSVLRQREKDDG